VRRQSTASTKLYNVRPNRNGGSATRPIRPKTEWWDGLSIAKRPPSVARVHLSCSLIEIEANTMRIKDISPEDR